MKEGSNVTPHLHTMISHSAGCRKDIEKLYTNGKIGDSHYQMLKDKVDEYYT
jgi:hypothetical protein